MGHRHRWSAHALSPPDQCHRQRHGSAAWVAAWFERHFSLVLHDIAPETWPDYQGFVAAIDRLSERLGPIPITWLVVPDFHGRGECRHSDALRRVLDSRLARGDELVLHGYFTVTMRPGHVPFTTSTCAASTLGRVSSTPSTRPPPAPCSTTAWPSSTPAAGPTVAS
nr:DUF2334 domain-containing protein [Salinicola tamaricis]